MILETIVFAIMLVLLIRNLNRPKIIYTNKYGATGPNPWPPHLPTGYKSPFDDPDWVEKFKTTGIGYTGPGPIVTGYEGYTGSVGSTGPSYTFGVRHGKIIKKKL